MSMSPELEFLMGSLSCVTYNGKQHTDIQIKESDPSAKLKTVNLKTEAGDWFCFSPDEGRKCKRIHNKSNMVVMSPLLTIDKRFDHHCACDAVIIMKKEGKLSILYIDLKSGNPTGYSSQFKSSRQFVRYLLGLYSEFRGESLPILEEKYVIFHGGNKILLNKSTTTLKPNIGRTSPDNAYKKEVTDGATVYLREIYS
ncbi:TPA: hypothetical protein ACK3JJ_000993 [Mannheimia haemolytica]